MKISKYVVSCLILKSGRDLQSVASRWWHLAFIKNGGYLAGWGLVARGLCWVLVIMKLRAEFHRGNVQGVVFEGTPEREERQERVRTGSARSAGKPTQQSIYHLLSFSFSLSLNPVLTNALFLSSFLLQLCFNSGILNSPRSASQGRIQFNFHILDHFLTKCGRLLSEF